jgi:hypothetical protein
MIQTKHEEASNSMAKKMPKAAVKKAHKIARKIARRGGVKNPYAVGMATEKKHLRKLRAKRGR